jgi:hypothetical protein
MCSQAPTAKDVSKSRWPEPRSRLGPRPRFYVLADGFLLRGDHPLPLAGLEYAPSLSVQRPGHPEGYPGLTSEGNERAVRLEQSAL